MTLICGVEEIRPGRKLFVWNFGIGDSSLSSENNSKENVNLVLVHGTVASHYQYLTMCEQLKSCELLVDDDKKRLSISVWVYDQVGCGESPRDPDPAAYSENSQIDDFQYIMEKVDTSKPTFLCGHSYGPQIIFKYLQSHPLQSLSGVILISTGFRDGPGPTFDGGPSIFRLPVILLKCLQSSMTNSFLKLGLAKATSAKNPELLDLVRTECNQNDMFVVKQYYSAMRWVSSFDARQAIGSSSDAAATRSIPSLVIHGIEDGILPVESGQFVANQLQAESFVAIEHASHLVMIEQPQKVAQAISNFLTSAILKKKMI